MKVERRDFGKGEEDVRVGVLLIKINKSKENIRENPHPRINWLRSRFRGIAYKHRSRRGTVIST